MASKTSTTETVKETYKEELVQPERASLTDAQRYSVLRDGTIVGTTKGDLFFGDAKTGTTYKGGEGDDTMLSSLGGVHFDGGAGSDTADYSDSKGAITVDLKAGTGERGDAKGDTYKSVENVIGTKYDDTLIGNDQINVLDGGAGDDVITPGQNTSGSDQVDGGEGFDTLDVSDFSRGVHVNMITGTLNKIGADGLETRKVDFESIESVIGTNHDDVFEAWNFTTSFLGRGGNDIYIATRNVDFSFDGGAGKDTLDMSELSNHLSYDFAANELQNYYTGEKRGELTNIEVLFATNGNNVIVNDNDLSEVYAGAGDDIFITNNLDFDLYDGGNPADLDTISFASATGSIGHEPEAEIKTYWLSEKVENVEKIIGTDFDDVLPWNFYKQDGGGGNDTFHLSQALIDAIPSAEWAGGVLTNYDPIVEFDGGSGVDSLNVTFGSDSGVIDLQGGSSIVDGQDVVIREIENLKVSHLDVTIIGNEADNEIVLFDYDVIPNNGEDFWEIDNPNSVCNATVSSGAGNDTVEMFYEKNSASTESFDFDGGEGFDTLSYRATGWDLLDGDPDTQETFWGLEIDVEDGTVQERRVGEAGETHTFQNVESFRGTQASDRFIDGEGSQTYEGFNFNYSLNDQADQWLAQDTFVFSNQNSDPGDIDTIVDFNTGEDLIDLSGTNRDSWAEILDGNWEQVGNDTLLDIGNGHGLVLQDVQFASLSDTDFIF